MTKEFTRVSAGGGPITESTEDSEPVEGNSQTKFSRRDKIPIYGTSISYGLGQSMIFTFLSYYGPVLGTNAIEQSILVSTRNLGSNVLQAAWGWLADHLGRKPVVIGGLMILALSTFLLILAQSPLQLVIISLLMSAFGFMFIPAWIALLGDYTEKLGVDRGRFVGFVNSLGNYSAVPLVILIGLGMDIIAGGLLGIERKEAYILPFGIGILFFMMTIGIGFLIRDIHREMNSDKRGLSFNELIADFRVNSPFRRLLLLDLSYKFIMSWAWPVFPFVSLSVTDSAFLIAIIWATFSLMRALGQSFGGWMCDTRLGRKGVIVVSRICFGFVTLFYAVSLIGGDFGIWFLLIGNVFGGACFGLDDTAIKIYSLDMSTRSTRATYYSVILFAEGFLLFAGSLVSGFIMSILQIVLGPSGIDNLGRPSTFVLLTMMVLISALRFTVGSSHVFLKPKPAEWRMQYESSQL